MILQVIIWLKKTSIVELNLNLYLQNVKSGRMTFPESFSVILLVFFSFSFFLILRKTKFFGCWKQSLIWTFLNFIKVIKDTLLITLKYFYNLRFRTIRTKIIF